MTIYYPSDSELLRAEIAALAARMIAEDGADYGTAKRKAAKQILGDAKVRGDILPDNAQVESEVRIYNELFFGESQPARLLHLRQQAALLMLDLQAFQPHLTGAVLNGTANEQSDIHLQLFADSPKDVEIFLLNKNMQFEVSESAHFKGRHYDPVETVSFMWHDEGVHLALYQTDDLRGAMRNASGRIERADLKSVQQLIIESNPQ
jgi:hypothetical protein